MSAQELVKKFNNSLRDLITILEKKARREEDIANIDRLKARIRLAKSTSEDFICISSVDTLAKYSDYIISRNDKFFLEMNVRRECEKAGEKIDATDDYIFSLVDVAKVYYTRASIDERNRVWDLVKVLFESAIEYKLIM